MDLPSKPVDFLIAGGGFAGCALAARFSKDAAACVLMIADKTAATTRASG
jgi:choline dehydrogenase-like flavoprotein